MEQKRLSYDTRHDEAEQSDAPQSWIGCFLMVSLLAATSVIAGVIGTVLMRTTATCFFLMLLVGCSTKPPAALTANNQNETVPDSKSVLGDWVIIEAMRNGEDYPSEVGGITTFIGSSAIARTNDGINTTYAVQFDQTKTPKHIDWTLTQDGASMTLYGVYELLDEHLTICSPPNFNIERPEKIETIAGDGRWLFKLKRNSNLTKNQ